MERPADCQSPSTHGLDVTYYARTNRGDATQCDQEEIQCRCVAEDTLFYCQLVRSSVDAVRTM